MHSIDMYERTVFIVISFDKPVYPWHIHATLPSLETPQLSSINRVSLS